VKVRILNEYNGNDYARRIHEVEELMRKNKVSFSYMGGNLIFVMINGEEFRLETTDIPRITEEEHLVIEEN